MKFSSSALIAALGLSSVQAFAPHLVQQNAKTPTQLYVVAANANQVNTIPAKNNFFPKHDKSIVGDFYGELNDSDDGIPMNNKFFPKHDKCLVGNFYGELEEGMTGKKPSDEQQAKPAFVVAASTSAAAAAAPPQQQQKPAPPATAPPQNVVASTTTTPVAVESPAPAATTATTATATTTTVNANNYQVSNKIVNGGDNFFGQINKDTDGAIPAKNIFFPKHDKCLVGNFYGDLEETMTSKRLLEDQVQVQAMQEKQEEEPALPLPEVEMRKQFASSSSVDAASPIPEPVVVVPAAAVKQMA